MKKVRKEISNQANVALQQQILLTDDGLDRQGHRRQQTDYIRSLQHSDDARYLLMKDHDFACSEDSVCLFSGKAMRDLKISISAALFIGLQSTMGDIPVFAVKAVNDLPLSEFQWLNLRELAVKISRPMANLLTTAQGLLFWHDNNRYCNRCGHATAPTPAGHSRCCTNSGCSHETYPRLDPAVIVLVIRGEQCLLARGKMWPEKRFSCLAGFVEAGESIEDAVKREVYEEVGLDLDAIHYQASQPWPFPQSLMLGFYATTQQHEMTFHDGEIIAADWYTADQLATAIQKRELLISSSLSISFQLMDNWYLQRTGESLVNLL